MNYKTVCIFFLFALNISAQSGFIQFISELNEILAPEEKQVLIEKYVNSKKNLEIPIIENDTAHFIYCGNADNVALAGDFNAWNPQKSQMIKCEGTNFFYRSEKFESTARLDYKIVINNSKWILDPKNPCLAPGGFGSNSELAMPAYIQPWEIKYDSSISHGKIIKQKFVSTLMNKSYNIQIYLPTGYNSSKVEGYPTVYFQDGGNYITLGSAINVLDNLIAHKKIKKLISVFVTPSNRMEEYGGKNRSNYSQSFATELVPFIDSVYNTTAQASQRLIIGTSLGGNISASICYNYPNIFENCGLHSAAFWVNNNEVFNLIVDGNTQPIKFAATWGIYESLLQNMRDFKNKIAMKGYNMNYLELHEGHSWGQWRATTDFLLETIFPYNQ